jgi:hypothetical protein
MPADHLQRASSSTDRVLRPSLASIWTPQTIGSVWGVVLSADGQVAPP